MHLTIVKICEYGKCNVQSRNFVEGERILKSKHLLKCGKSGTQLQVTTLIAFCMQSSNLKGDPHTITCNIHEDGSIISCKCTCKAVLSEICKHVLAVLLYCNRFDINDLEEISCTDIKCAWKEPQKQCLKEYVGAKVEDHECFKKTYKNCDNDFTPEQIEKIKFRLFNSGENALTKHAMGRHEIISINLDPEEESSAVYDIIFSEEESETMKLIFKIPINALKPCCQKKYEEMCSVNVLIACLTSKISFQEWSSIRQLRVTGSRVYKLFTYCSNKNQDWNQKSIKYFYPKPFSNKYIEHGKKMEKVAIQTYETLNSIKVETCGCVISKLNPWMSYSPDGIVIGNGKPHKLIEIKCPGEGMEKNIDEFVHKLRYVQLTTNNEICLKKKCDYYGQIQMGMAVLNIDSTDFIIYASFDNSMKVINVPFDSDFTLQMLSTVKNCYFNTMLHFVCKFENNQN